MTPTGSEQSYKTPGKSAIRGVGGNTGGNTYAKTDSKTAELLRLWEVLDDADRAEVLAVACGLASVIATEKCVYMRFSGRLFSTVHVVGSCPANDG